MRRASVAGALACLVALLPSDARAQCKRPPCSLIPQTVPAREDPPNTVSTTRRGYGFISGRVVADSGRVAMPGVSVFAAVGPTRMRATTDEAGRFRIMVPAGTYSVFARRIGFRETVMAADVRSAGHQVYVELRMRPAPVDLAGVTVEARRTMRASALQRVAERRYLGLGAFVDRAEIARRGGPPLTDLLRSVPGVRVTGSGPDAMVTMARVAHGCYPVVFLDGTRLNRAFDQASEIAAIVAMIPGRTIEAIEVYRGPAETPGDFGGADAPCGVVGVWSIDPTRETSDHAAPAPPPSR